MSPPDRFRETAPHPESLARLFIAYGETEAAFRICEIWRSHDPSNPRIAEVEQEAETSEPTQDGVLSLDVTDAERFLQNGYLREALFIYRRLSASSWRKTNSEVRQRAELLAEFIAFELPDDAPPKMVEAEASLRQRRLPMALLGYHEMAEASPHQPEILRRRDQLRALIMEMPRATRVEEIAALGDTINDAVGAAPSVQARRQLPTQTEPSLPSFDVEEDQEDDGDDDASFQRLRARTDLDLPLVDKLKVARESAPTERDLRVPPDLLESPAALSLLAEVTSTDDDQPPALRLEKEPTPMMPGVAPSLTPDWMHRFEEQSPRRGMARTIPSSSPLVLTEDEQGCSVVEVPSEIPNVMERIGGRLSVLDAAELAEPFGVLVRQIHIID